MPPNMNDEIEAALQEFNQQEANYNAKRIERKDHQVAFMPALLINYTGGLIKTERQAEYVLLLLGIVGIIFSIFFYVNNRAEGEYAPLKLPTPYEEGRL